MTDSQALGFVLLVLIVTPIVARDWRWLLVPITFTLIFAYLIWWANRPLESASSRIRA